MTNLERYTPPDREGIPAPVDMKRKSVVGYEN